MRRVRRCGCPATRKASARRPKRSASLRAVNDLVLRLRPLCLRPALSPPSRRSGVRTDAAHIQLTNWRRPRRCLDRPASPACSCSMFGRSRVGQSARHAGGECRTPLERTNLLHAGRATRGRRLCDADVWVVECDDRVPRSEWSLVLALIVAIGGDVEAAGVESTPAGGAVDRRRHGPELASTEVETLKCLLRHGWSHRRRNPYRTPERKSE